MRKLGDRIGSICGSDRENKIIRFFGYGTYQGEEIPPDGVFGLFGMSAKELGIPNPKLQLDSGDIVWGCESWWASEEKIKSMMEEHKKQGYTVKKITPEEYRSECQKICEEKADQTASEK